MKKSDLKTYCKKAIKTYPNEAKKYKAGKVGLMGIFIGEVMKLSKGTADPRDTVFMLKEILGPK